MNQKRKGFTLAELLIVVAIIGILVTIAIPVFAGKLDDARLNAAAANVRSKFSELAVEAMTSGNEDSDEGVIYVEIPLSKLKDAVADEKVKLTVPRTVPIEGGYLDHVLNISIASNPAKYIEIDFGKNVSINDKK